MKFRTVEAKLLHAERRTDMTKIIVAFRNFANAPKNAQKNMVDFNVVSICYVIHISKYNDYHLHVRCFCQHNKGIWGSGGIAPLIISSSLKSWILLNTCHSLYSSLELIYLKVFGYKMVVRRYSSTLYYLSLKILKLSETKKNIFVSKNFVSLLVLQNLHNRSVSYLITPAWKLNEKLIKKVYLYCLFLTLYVPCIVTNSINKQTRCTFCMYLFYNLFITLHVSNETVVQNM